MSISTEQSYGEGIERSHYISNTKEATDHFFGQHRNQYYAGRKHTKKICTKQYIREEIRETSKSKCLRMGRQYQSCNSRHVSEVFVKTYYPVKFPIQSFTYQNPCNQSSCQSFTCFLLFLALLDLKIYSWGIFLIPMQ